jgi:hypothetical protein
LLSDDTVTVLGYLAGSRSRRRRQLQLRLVEQEIVPRLKTVDTVANVNISGGQLLPGESGALAAVSVAATPSGESASLLLQLSPEVWEVVSRKAGDLGSLDAG